MTNVKNRRAKSGSLRANRLIVLCLGRGVRFSLPVRTGCPQFFESRRNLCGFTGAQALLDQQRLAFREPENISSIAQSETAYTLVYNREG